MGDNIHISGVGNDAVVVGKVTGSGNVIGKGNTVTQTISVPPESTSRFPGDLSGGLKDFLEQINKQLLDAPDHVKKGLNDIVNGFFGGVNEAIDKGKNVGVIVAGNVANEIGDAKNRTSGLLGGPQSSTAAAAELPKIPYTTRTTLKEKFVKMAQGLLKVLPKTAETIAGFTPLAPFSKVIGESVTEIVKAVATEG